MKTDRGFLRNNHRRDKQKDRIFNKTKWNEMTEGCIIPLRDNERDYQVTEVREGNSQSNAVMTVGGQGRQQCSE